MSNWEIRDFSYIISIMESGLRPKGGVSVDSGEIPSFGGENIIQSGGISYNNLNKVPTKFFDMMKKGILKDKDVLINKDGANTGKVGLFNNSRFQSACINEHLFLIRGKAEAIIQDYIYYFLLSPKAQQIIKTKISGSAQPGLNTKFIENFPISYPKDKSVQTRIAEILSTADKAIEESEKLIAKYKRMKTGMMQDLLTKGIDENGNIRSEATHKFKDSPLGRIPVEWEVKRLEEVCFYISDGSHFSPKAREEGFVIGNVKDMEEFDFNYNSCTKISIRDYEFLVSQNCQPLKGDILLSKDGTIGKVFVFNSEKKIVILSSIAILRPSDKYSSFYLSYLLKSQYLNKNLIKFISGSALKRIIIRDIKKMIFPMSSDEGEQKRISDYLSEIESLVFVETQTLSKLKRLKIGLMNDLLSGKVEIVDSGELKVEN